MEKTFMYMWEYHVKESMVHDFENAYGPGGDWVKLFKKSKGYIKTELHKDVNNKGRYVTVDYWQSQKACEDFRENYAEEFLEIDEECEALTLKEISLGSFNIIDG